MSHLLESNDYNVVKKFEAIAQDFPEYTAITDRNKKISYKSLNEKSNQIAEYLKAQNVKSGDFVAILLEPNIDFIVCMLAAIKIGAVYLPLDISAPKKRINEILEDAKPKVIITNEKFKSLIHESCSISNIKDIKIECINFPIINQSIELLPSSPIYMMYTSGSTGKPKGVIVPHQAAVNLCHTDNYVQVKKHQIVAQFSNLAFDACTFEIWSALLNGATLNIIPNHIRVNSDKLSMFFEKNSIDYLFLPTAYFHQIIKSSPDALDGIQTIVFGGEQVNLNLLKEFIQYRKNLNKTITLINGYGPTEATTFTCLNTINEQNFLPDEDLKSIGKPFQNIKTYILNEQMQPSDEGELYISGINLALGYHNSDVQNKEKFIQNPFSNEAPYQRMYKTGDKVRLLPSGNILCLGRLDDQVKVGGFRVHLNEVENTLMTYSNIALAAVVVELGGGEHKMLTAYIVLSDKSRAIHADDIRSFLAESLPVYMLPSKYVMVEELPLTLVGKVDKKKLDQVSHTDLSFHIDASNSHPIEKEIQSIWCHLLNRTSVDIHKNFFDLGANSLLITESCSLINQKLHAELKIADILAHPTIYKLSRYIEGDSDVQSIKKHKHIASSDIAIIGMSCRFPKANSLNEFWDNLCNQVDCLEHFELSEDDLEKKNYVPVRGVLSDIESFDANFFGFSPVDASITDPQHRLFLEVAWEALEHAGVAPQKSADKTIGVFAGMTDSSYLQENLLKNNWFLSEYDHFQQRISNSIGMLSTQLSYRLNLKGRSVNVNTACSTGLVAVDQACQDLMLGDSDIALAGAVSIIVPQQRGYQYQKGSIVSLNGICAPFSDKANGTVFSNGIGVVILKRLDDAVKEGDTIYAVIKGRGANNDGSDKLGYAAPSRSGQIACILSALEKSNLKGDDIRYIEAHGTATHLGDIVEFDALKDAFKTQTTRKQFCALGTVKSNIGHTDVAAGMAGLIKTALCLHNQYIPSMPHYENPNPELRIDKSPFFINKEPIVWDNKSSIHLAGVSAFGVGGTNIHMILSEYRAPRKTNNKKSKPTQQLIVLSAKSQAALEEMTESFISYLSKPERNTPGFLQKAAFTLQTGREDFAYRRYAIGQNRDEIKASLSKYAIQYCEKNINTNIVFMFPGQGTQYPKMAQELMQVPYFEKIVNLGAKLASKYLNCDFLSLLQEENPKELNETQYAQPALFIIEYALAKLLIHYGIQPNALIGHSLGEYVAACLADVFSFEDGVALVCQRGLLMASAPKGAMLAIECSIENFERFQKTVPGIELALHNSSQHCVASGTSQEMELLEEQLKINGMTYQKLNVSHAFHSRLMEPIKDNFIDMLSNINFNTPNIPIISNLTGDWLSAKDAVDPNYWYQHLRNTVKLKSGLDTLAKDKNSFFIEVGPKRSLSYFLKSVLSDDPKHTHIITHTLAIANDLQQVLDVVGLAWIKSININWPNLHNNVNVYKTALPTYFFQKEKYWISADRKLSSNNIRYYQPSWTHQKIYLNNEEPHKDSLRKHSWVIIKDSLGLADKIASYLNTHNVKTWVIGYDEISSEPKEHYLNLAKDIKNHQSSPVFLNLSSYGVKNDRLVSNKEIQKQLNHGFYNLLYLAQALTEAFDSETHIKIGILTSGTQQPTGSEALNTINATLNGAAHVIAQEHPNLKLKIFDLDSDDKISETTIYKLIDTCCNLWDDAFSIETYRHQYKYNLYFQEIKPNKIKFERLKDNGVYLLTGGLGGIALTCCEAIVESVANPVFILLARKSMPPREQWEDISLNADNPNYDKVKKLIHLEKLGAKVSLHKVDISNLESLKKIIEHCIERFETINGVIHTAGVAISGLMQSRTHESIQETFAPKIFGTANLINVFKEISLDFVVLKSSISALLGGFGHVDYAAANSFLDTVAISNLFTKTKFVMSINWNTWLDVGIAARNQKEGKVSFIGKGNDISPQEGKKIFLEVLQGDSSQVAISRININDTQESLIPDLTISSPKISREKLPTLKIYSAPTNKLESTLLELWQNSLGIDGLGVEDDFFALGGHSLQAIKLIGKINNTFHCNLPMTQIYTSPTVRELSTVITDKPTTQKQSPLILLKKVSQKPPYLFVFHPISGLINCFDPLIKLSTLDMSIYGLQDPGINTNRIVYHTLDSMINDYLEVIQHTQSIGPYYFLGYSFGGVIAYEVANKLKLKGEQTRFLGLIDSWAINPDSLQNEEIFKHHLMSEHPDLSESIINLSWEREKLLLNYELSRTNQEMVLFKATEQLHDFKQYKTTTNRWELFNTGKLICHNIKGTHQSIINYSNSKNMLYLIHEHLK